MASRFCFGRTDTTRTSRVFAARSRLNRARCSLPCRSTFPAGYRVTRPEGGYFVWVELPRGADALEMHRLALDQGISVAPGPIFSPRREFRNCVRLNYGHPWSAEMDRAIVKLGRIATG